MTDITSIGEILIDMTQTGVNENGIECFAANPGGAPANVAVAAARLGASTAFLGKVGWDHFGESLLNTLKANGVDTSAVRQGSTPTTMAFVSVAPDGERSFSFLRGADQDYSVSEVADHMLTNTRILHFGSVSLTAGPSRSATIYAGREARHKGAVISYDPNYRPALWPDEKSAQEWMLIPLPLVDIIKLSEEELPLVSGIADLEEGTAALDARGIRLILVTLGGAGVYYRLGSQTGRVPGYSVKVQDTNGAGDTFLGAVLSRLARREKGPLDHLTAGELEEILVFANRAAALTCSRSGAIPAMPTAEEVETFAL